MRSEKGSTLPLDNLRELDPLETIGAISAYKLHPKNFEKEAMIEFAVRLAASYSRGSRRPTSQELQSFIQSVGEFYKYYPINETRPLEAVFTNYALFSNRVESSLEQTIESIWKRFQKHDKFLEEKLGFNVANTIFFASEVLSTITHRMRKTKPPKIKKLTKSEYYDFAFFVKPEDRIIRNWSKAIQFNLEELISIFPKHLLAKAKKYLEFATIPFSSLPEIHDPLEANPLFGAPIIKFQNNISSPRRITCSMVLPQDCSKHFVGVRNIEVVMERTKVRCLKNGQVKNFDCFFVQANYLEESGINQPVPNQTLILS